MNSFAKEPSSTPTPGSTTGPSTIAGGEDLSNEIRLTVDREPGDVVRCTRVSDRHYRCNWWRSQLSEGFDNPGMKGGQLGTTFRVRKSSFLEVTRVGAGDIQIQEIVSKPRRRAFV